MTTTTVDASPLFGLVLDGNRTHLLDLVTGRALCARPLSRRTTQHAITDAADYARGAAIRPAGSHCTRCDIAATRVTTDLVAAILGSQS